MVYVEALRHLHMSCVVFLSTSSPCPACHEVCWWSMFVKICCRCSFQKTAIALNRSKKMPCLAWSICVFIAAIRAVLHLRLSTGERSTVEFWDAICSTRPTALKAPEEGIAGMAGIPVGGMPAGMAGIPIGGMPAGIAGMAVAEAGTAISWPGSAVIM